MSVEWMCSGSGIPNIYRFLKDEGIEQEPQWLSERLRVDGDQTPMLLRIALETGASVPICKHCVDIFVSILAAEAGNLVLRFVARGGVYLGGVIPPRIVPFLEHSSYLKILQNKGRLSNLVIQTPVQIILDTKSALIGAAIIGLSGESKNNQEGKQSR